MREVTLNVERKMWAADDGTTFERKRDCVKYENKSKFDALVKANGQCLRYVDDEGIKELTEYYLDTNRNSLSSFTELYLAKVDNDKDADQVAAFCEMKEGAGLEHWHCQFRAGERYLICVHSSMTLKYGDDSIVYVIPYKEFKHFWSIMMSKVETLWDYEIPHEPIKSPFKHFNEIIKEYGNSIK